MLEKRLALSLCAAVIAAGFSVSSLVAQEVSDDSPAIVDDSDSIAVDESNSVIDDDLGGDLPAAPIEDGSLDDPVSTGLVDDDHGGLGIVESDGGLDAPETEEDLMFSNIELVITASRQAQRITETSAPVTVISADDIHFSGATSIAQALQYANGVDLYWRDRNNPQVGIRGMHQAVGDRTLALINGRNANEVVSGGVVLTTLPVLPEDIERIEVVRGPSGGAFGANAFNGVINIITKRPEDMEGFLASVTVNEFGDHWVHNRLAEGTEDFSWKISVGYNDIESSDDAIANDTISGQLVSQLNVPVVARDYSLSL